MIILTQRESTKSCLSIEHNQYLKNYLKTNLFLYGCINHVINNGSMKFIDCEEKFVFIRCKHARTGNRTGSCNVFIISVLIVF